MKTYTHEGQRVSFHNLPADRKIAILDLIAETDPNSDPDVRSFTNYTKNNSRKAKRRRIKLVRAVLALRGVETTTNAKGTRCFVPSEV